MNEHVAGGARVSPSYRFRPSVATVLVGVFGALILLAVASVLWLSLKSARTGTTELIADKAMLVVRSVALGVREHLQPAQDQVERLAELTMRGVVDPSDRAFGAVLTAALSATPQVKLLVFLSPRLEAKVAVWAPDGQATFTWVFRGPGEAGKPALL